MYNSYVPIVNLKGTTMNDEWGRMTDLPEPIIVYWYEGRTFLQMAGMVMTTLNVSN
jgi:hypothetical protein